MRSLRAECARCIVQPARWPPYHQLWTNMDEPFVDGDGLGSLSPNPALIHEDPSWFTLPLCPKGNNLCLGAPDDRVKSSQDRARQSYFVKPPLAATGNQSSQTYSSDGERCARRSGARSVSARVSVQAYAPDVEPGRVCPRGCETRTRPGRPPGPRPLGRGLLRLGGSGSRTWARF